MVELVVDMGILTEQQLIDGVEIPPIEWQRHLQQQRLARDYAAQRVRDSVAN